MSEYQYYEFAALERPLTKQDMERLRAVSSRGRITPSSFVNHYEWGDFKGDPMDWMARYFDAFVYFANWGSCCLSLRLPLAAFQRSDIEPYMLEPSMSVEATATHWIFSWTVDENEDPERFEEEEGRGWMSRLVALRDELARGDLRPLYLGWLAGTAFNSEDADLAPAVPAGLGELTPAQRALTEFIALDVDLLAAAATGSTSAADDTRARTSDLDAWLAQCSREDLLAMVKPLARERTGEAQQELLRRFSAWQQQHRPRPKDSSSPMRVVQLREQAAAIATERLAREAQAEAARAAASRRRREKELRTLMQQADQRWDVIDALARQGTAVGYSELVPALKELAEAYAIVRREVEFERLLGAWVQRYTRRSALRRRLEVAGLWR